MARVPSALPVGPLGAATPQIGPTVFDATRASQAFGARPSQIGAGLQDLGGCLIRYRFAERVR